MPELPDFLRGKAFALVEAAFLGGEEEAAELLRPLRELSPDMDTFRNDARARATGSPHGPARARASVE
jgi:hypothetical protein